ncbi:hypothetical protein RCL1_006447 [Eukaryota sp. TZLM3-RCL]
MLEDSEKEESFLFTSFSPKLLDHFLSNSTKFLQAYSERSVSPDVFLDSTHLAKLCSKSDLLSAIDFVKASFPRIKFLKGGSKEVLCSRFSSFLQNPELFFPSSITVSLSKNNLNVCCFNCGSTLTTDKLKFSFCHKCPPEDAFPTLKIPCIVKPDLSSSLAFALSTVFQSLIDSNSWNPSPFWDVFDKGEVEVSQNTFRKVNNDLGKQFERSLWLGRYSSAHSLLNNQALALVNFYVY